MPLKKYTSAQLVAAYKNACMAELQALKPGNVHTFADGHGMTIYDFINSADASANLSVSISKFPRVLYASK